jgi:hypothetical protein
MWSPAWSPAPPNLIAGGVPPQVPTPCGPLPPAFPAGPPQYVIPGSHWNDPAYWQQPRNPDFFDSGWPTPRTPWPFETESRAAGTGLLAGPSPTPPPFPPCPPCPPCPPSWGGGSNWWWWYWNWWNNPHVENRPGPQAQMQFMRSGSPQAQLARRRRQP